MSEIKMTSFLPQICQVIFHLLVFCYEHRQVKNVNGSAHQVDSPPPSKRGQGPHAAILWNLSIFRMSERSKLVNGLQSHQRSSEKTEFSTYICGSVVRITIFEHQSEVVNASLSIGILFLIQLLLNCPQVHWMLNDIEIILLKNKKHTTLTPQLLH